MTRTRLSSFILTVITLIMLLAVLSTATYAWYTVVNRASGNSIMFTASSNDVGGGDLAIGWSADDRTNFSLTFDEPNGTLYPMIPKRLPVIDTTTFTEFTSANFNSSNQTQNTLEEWICTVGGQDVNPHICTGEADPAKDMFYLINRNDSYDLSVNVIYDITGGVLADKLRVAVFVGSNASNRVFKGVLSKAEAVHYGQIYSGDKVAEIPVMGSDIQKATMEISFTIPRNDIATVSFVAWLDGADMLDSDSSKVASFAVKFDGVPV